MGYSYAHKPWVAVTCYTSRWRAATTDRNALAGLAFIRYSRGLAKARTKSSNKPKCRPTACGQVGGVCAIHCCFGALLIISPHELHVWHPL